MRMVRAWWRRNRRWALWAAVGVTFALAVYRHGVEAWYFWQSWTTGRFWAIDMRFLHQAVQPWFAGEAVYEQIGSAVYPPATYAMLWPLLGWLELVPARWLWAAVSYAGLAVFGYLIATRSGAGTRPERLFLGLLPASVYATTTTIHLGQLGLLVLPTLLAGLLVTTRKRGTWAGDLWGAALFLFALVKPTIAAPFFWLVVFVPGRLRPALLVVLGYAAMTALAVSFQPGSFLEVFSGASASSVQGVAVGAVTGAHANLHTWLGRLGLQAYNLPVSLLVLGAFGVWVYRYRHRDLWLLIGAAALVARFWAYHRLYDDLLIVLAVVALVRVALQGASRRSLDVMAGLLALVACASIQTPGRMLFMDPPWNGLFEAAQSLTWLAVLAFLLWLVHRDSLRIHPAAASATRDAPAASSGVGHMEPAARTLLVVDHAEALGGAEQSLLLLLQHLGERGWRPHLACCGDALAQQAARIGVPVHTVPLPRLRRSARFLIDWYAGVQRLARLAAEVQAAGLYANTVRAACYALPAARLARRPGFWHLRDFWLRETRPRLLVLDWLGKKVLGGMASRVLVNSHAVAQGLPYPAAVVHNGIDVERFNPALRDPAFRQRHAIPTGQPLVGMVGRLRPWKGPERFLRVAARVRSAVPEVHFVVVGGDPFQVDEAYPASLRALADELGLAGHVTFTGQVDDVRPALAEMAVFVHPGEPEPFGLVNVEAMAMARPVIAFAHGALPEIVADGQTGRLVPPDDQAALAEAIVALLRHPEQGRRWGEAGRRRVEAQFSARRMAGEVAAVLAASLTAPSSKAPRASARTQ